MKTTIVSLRPAQMGHKLFVCITHENIFAEGNSHTVCSLCKPNPTEKIRFRSWINSHHDTGIEWNRITKRLNFEEEME
jgi:hypothetical protein